MRRSQATRGTSEGSRLRIAAAPAGAVTEKYASGVIQSCSCEASASAPPDPPSTDDERRDRHATCRHGAEQLADRGADAGVLGGGVVGRARGVDEGQQREPERVGEAHEPGGGTEAGRRGRGARLGGVGDAATVPAADADQHARVCAAGAIAGELEPRLEVVVEVGTGLRAPGVAGTLHAVPAVGRRARIAERAGDVGRACDPARTRRQQRHGAAQRRVQGELRLERVDEAGGELALGGERPAGVARRLRRAPCCRRTTPARPAAPAPRRRSTRARPTRRRWSGVAGRRCAGCRPPVPGRRRRRSAAAAAATASLPACGRRPRRRRRRPAAGAGARARTRARPCRPSPRPAIPPGSGSRTRRAPRRWRRRGPRRRARTPAVRCASGRGRACRDIPATRAGRSRPARHRARWSRGCPSCRPLLEARRPSGGSPRSAGPAWAAPDGRAPRCGRSAAASPAARSSRASGARPRRRAPARAPGARRRPGRACGPRRRGCRARRNARATARRAHGSCGRGSRRRGRRGCATRWPLVACSGASGSRSTSGAKRFQIASLPTAMISGRSAVGNRP